MEIFDQYIEINNSRQNIMTMRTNRENPVLLIVHGGAGLPDRPLVKQYSSELAEYYTVICWDQRGCGLSCSKGKLDIWLLIIRTGVLFTEKSELCSSFRNCFFGKHRTNIHIVIVTEVNKEIFCNKF